MSDIYQWTGNSNTDIGSQANWFDESNPGMGTVPRVNDVAIIQVGQGLFGTLNVDAMDIVQASGAPTISMTGSSTAVTAASLNIAYGFTLDTGAFLQSTDLSVDGSGTNVTVQNGAYLYCAGDANNNLDIGATTGATNLTITKGGVFTYASDSASGTLNVGDYNGNTATLTVNSGAYVDSTLAQFSVGAVAGSSGVVNISGAGTQFFIDDNGFTNIGDFGEQGGSSAGTLSVTGGAYASLVALGEMDVGTTGGMAKLLVSGAGSDISAGPYIEIGIYQTNIAGEVIVQSGGEFDTATDALLNNGTISVSGANSLFTGRVLSADAGTLFAVASGGVARLADVELGGTARITAGTLDVRAQFYLYGGSQLNGYGTVTATTLVNNGTIVANGGTLALSSSITGTGTELIDNHSTLRLAGGAVATQSIHFASGAGTLALADVAGVGARIVDFATGDAIDLVNTAATSLSYATASGLTIDNGTAKVGRLLIKGSYTTASFKLASDGHGGSLITFAGTNAVTPRPIGDPIAFAGHAHPSA